MPSKIQRMRIKSGAIDSSGDATAHSTPIHGKILAVHINYPTHTCTVDIDSDETKDQKILDLAAANTDVVYYPRVAFHDNTGSALDLSDTEGGNTAVYGEFVVSGRLLLTIASGTEDEEVVVDVIYEAY